jgi:Putative metallopeptidase
MRLWCGLGAAVLVVALSSMPVPAQPPMPDSAGFEARLSKAVRTLAETEPRLRQLPLRKRQRLIEFVIGNMLFVTAHEVGHGVLAEMEIPNAGRDEDAADAFAILTALKLGSSFSHRVLTEAAKGWYLADLRDKKTGEKPTYYDAHAMNLQRAYHIVCLMVGSDAEKYRELADIAGMPMDRQQSCKDDFRTAQWSWETLLKPHLRAPDKPTQQVEVIYGPASGKLQVYARSFRELRFLEPLVEYLVQHFAWPKPLTMEMQGCGEVGASWRSRRLRLCYEMAEDFAELYGEYGGRLKSLRPRTPLNVREPRRAP